MDSIDVGIWVGLGLTALMGGFVIAFYLLRDREGPSERRLRALVLCPVNESPALITVIESRQSGVATRQVEDCSVRSGLGTCHEECAWRIRL